ncbi:MAG: glutamyl-tRNA reductase [Omnitrophica bacterium]|nr:glutamyl-tRNA reductase [Candidatus Omnitrophota bacterium]
MEYNIAVIGLNHKTSPIEVRETVSFTISQREGFLKKLKTFYPFGEFVILSTCNRVEIYIGSRQEEIDIARIIFLLASYHNISRKQVSPFIYTYAADEAISHLFEVAVGIDSLVIGETQVLGQMKKSYQQALGLGITGKVLNMAFQRAFAVSKKVRVLTKISEGNVSISSIACQLAEEVLEDFSEKKVLLVGTGKIGRLTLKSLRDRGASTIFVSSRSYEKAKILAEEFKGVAVRLEEIDDFIVDTDVVISATSAPHCILHSDMVKRIMAKRNNRPIFLIDLAVPRDIDPAISKIPTVHLYNVDSLKRTAEENMKKREKKISHCKEIIAEETELFMKQRIEYLFARMVVNIL